MTIGMFSDGIALPRMTYVPGGQRVEGEPSIWDDRGLGPLRNQSALGPSGARSSFKLTAG